MSYKLIKKANKNDCNKCKYKENIYWDYVICKYELTKIMEKNMNKYRISDSFFVNTDEKWVRIKYNEIKFIRTLVNTTVIFLTGERTVMANHQLWEVAKMLSNDTRFVRINASEIVNVDYIDGFKDNCYYIGNNSLYVTNQYKSYLKEYFEDITIHN